jgi:hypothetical protein
MITANSIVDVSREPLHHLCLENDLARVYWIDLAPGIATQFHRHERPYAGICVGDSKIRNEIVGEGAVESCMNDGDVIYTPGKMAHRITNIGESAFQNITMEVLRSPGHKASSLKRLEHELKRLCIVIDEPALRVAVVELATNEKCELVGDHLVVWLKGQIVAATFERAGILRQPGDFAWCCGMATVESIASAKAAIVEIG